MHWQAAVRKRLLDDPAVAALVARRIDWGERPQGTGLPALVLHLSPDTRPQHMKGFIEFRESRVQVVAVAADAAKAATIIEAVVEALAPGTTVSDVKFGRAFFENERTTQTATDTTTIHGRSIDARIWHT